MRSSPWMRSAPQVGFSTTIRKINSRTFFGVCFLPISVRTLEISLQYKRNPARCLRTTVSGVTTMRVCFQPDQTRRATTQKSLSKRPKIGHARCRFSTVSCCRSARFSRTRCRRLRNTRASAPNQRRSRLNMARSYTRIVDGHRGKLLILRSGGVLARDKPSSGGSRRYNESRRKSEIVGAVCAGWPRALGPATHINSRQFPRPQRAPNSDRGFDDCHLSEHLFPVEHQSSLAEQLELSHRFQAGFQ